MKELCAIETGNGIRRVATGLTAKRMALRTIPVIDFAPIVERDSRRQTTAQQIRDACVHSGFFYLKNHGVPQPVIDAAFTQMKQFFALSLEEKMTLHIAHSPNHRGYVPLREEILNSQARPDLHEAFDLALEVPADDPDVLAGKYLYGSNVWPTQLPNFRSTINDYYAQVYRLGKQLFEAIALILNLPEDYFEDKVNKPIGQLRLLHTPPQFGKIDEQQIGTGAHTDYECFTILAQEDVPGLQVLNSEGEWIAADPIPGTFLVNIGDQMARWTNDWFVSTVHRGINRSGRDRFSIPYFVGPNYDTLLEVLPNCTRPGIPAKYPPVTAGEYSISRFNQTFAYRRETAH